MLTMIFNMMLLLDVGVATGFVARNSGTPRLTYSAAVSLTLDFVSPHLG